MLEKLWSSFSAILAFGPPLLRLRFGSSEALERNLPRRRLGNTSGWNCLLRPEDDLLIRAFMFMDCKTERQRASTNILRDLKRDYSLIPRTCKVRQRKFSLLHKLVSVVSGLLVKRHNFRHSLLIHPYNNCNATSVKEIITSWKSFCCHLDRNCIYFCVQQPGFFLSPKTREHHSD